MKVKAGDIVWKKPGAGFTGLGCFVEIQDDDCSDLDGHDEDDHMPCMLDCEDEECLEWATAWVIDAETLDDAKKLASDGQYIGSVYHLSECEVFKDKA